VEVRHIQNETSEVNAERNKGKQDDSDSVELPKELKNIFDKSN